jgi:hypothetical protein
MGLAQAGADLAIASRKLPDLERVAAGITKAGKCLPVAAHVGRVEEVNNLVKKVVGEFGRIDILVNNAATNPTMAQALDVDERAWDSIMNLNLKGLFFLSQAVARVMKEKGGGKIINVSSIAGIIRPAPVYSISKAAVIIPQGHGSSGPSTTSGRHRPGSPRPSSASPLEQRYETCHGLPMGRVGEPEKWSSRPVSSLRTRQLRDRSGHRHRRRQTI